jgi:hypothetical protein
LYFFQLFEFYYNLCVFLHNFIELFVFYYNLYYFLKIFELYYVVEDFLRDEVWVNF